MAMASDEAKHDYHLTDPSPWPFVGALGLFVMLLGAVMWLNEDSPFLGIPLFVRPFICGGGAMLLAFALAGWWRDAIFESVHDGEHKLVVILSFRFAIALFLLAEAAGFAALCWAYFDMALFRSAGVGWPPPGATPADPWRLPLLATLILLLSGTAVRWAQRAILAGDNRTASRGLMLAVILGAIFAALTLAGLLRLPVGQGAAAIYASVFLPLTGALFLHAVAGVVLLGVACARALAGHFAPTRHFGFEAASWFWLFGIGIWIFLYATVYVMGWVFAPH
jgi:cytochrome c oxidase subunit III